MVYLTDEGQKALEEINQNERYKEKLRKEKRRFDSNLPCFFIDEFPVSRNENLYAWRYKVSDGRARRREDLKGETYKGLESDIHECVHDPFNDTETCEYNTRRKTEMHLETIFGKEKNKYKGVPNEDQR